MNGMQPAQYKFERFANPRFPIYLSSQSGRETLAKIHYHTSAEIIQVTSGRIRLLCGSAHAECGAGDLIFVPPSAVHEVTSLTEDAAISGVIYEPAVMEMADLQLSFSALFTAAQRMPYVVERAQEGWAQLCECVDRIHALYGDSSIAARMQIAASLLQMEALLIQRFALEENAADRRFRKLLPVLDYLKAHYAEKIQLSQLSGLIHVCDDRLIRLFREVTGETPVTWLTNLRIEACIKLLVTTDDTIAAIAEQTGFGSDTYMTRVFKQKLGTTPGRYRRR